VTGLEQLGRRELELSHSKLQLRSGAHGVPEGLSEVPRAFLKPIIFFCIDPDRFLVAYDRFRSIEGGLENKLANILMPCLCGTDKQCLLSRRGSDVEAFYFWRRIS
jgi:hypothetical protein